MGVCAGGGVTAADADAAPPGQGAAAEQPNLVDVQDEDEGENYARDG